MLLPITLPQLTGTETPLGRTGIPERFLLSLQCSPHQPQCLEAQAMSLPRRANPKKVMKSPLSPCFLVLEIEPRASAMQASALPMGYIPSHLLTFPTVASHRRAQLHCSNNLFLTFRAPWVERADSCLYNGYDSFLVGFASPHAASRA